MNTSSCLRLFPLVAFLLTVCSVPLPAAGQSGPNIVLIMVDDMGGSDNLEVFS